MVDFNIKVELGEEGIQKLINNYEEYIRALELAQEDILKALSEYMLSKIKENIRNTTGLTGYSPTGNLENSFTYEIISKDMAKVYTENEYARFVEFGTGVVGSSNTHTQSDSSWTYRDNGWWYQDTDGNWWFTQGEVAHEFFQNAYEDLKSNANSIIRRVLIEKGLAK